MTKFTQTYPTDLKYTEWQLIEDFFPSKHMGRPRKWDMWQIINAIRYCSTHGLPVAHDAQGFAAVANCVWLLSALEETRTLGAHQ